MQGMDQVHLKSPLTPGAISTNEDQRGQVQQPANGTPQETENRSEQEDAKFRRLLGMLLEQGLSEATARARINSEPRLRQEPAALHKQNR